MCRNQNKCIFCMFNISHSKLPQVSTDNNIFIAWWEWKPSLNKRFVRICAPVLRQTTCVHFCNLPVDLGTIWSLLSMAHSGDDFWWQQVQTRTVAAPQSQSSCLWYQKYAYRQDEVAIWLVLSILYWLVQTYFAAYWNTHHLIVVQKLVPVLKCHAVLLGL